MTTALGVGLAAMLTTVGFIFETILIGGFGALFVVVPQLLAGSPYFRFTTKHVYIKHGIHKERFSFNNLRVDAPEPTEHYGKEAIDFWNKKKLIRVDYHGLGSMLDPRLVWALAELQARGALILCPGFGSYAIPHAISAEQTIRPKLGRYSTAAWIGIAVSVILAILLLLEKIPDFGILLLVLALIPLVVYGFKQNSLITLGTGISYPDWLEVSNESVKLHHKDRVTLKFTFQEVKTIYVTIDAERHILPRLSIEVVTHYGRTYKILSRKTFMPFSHSLFLERARGLGLHIVYRRIAKGSEEMMVIHEVEPEVDLLSLLDNEPVFDLDTEINPGLVDQNQAL